jgi:hypothetical protein
LTFAVRSDLDALEAAGGIRRIRGGAMLGPIDRFDALCQQPPR